MSTRINNGVQPGMNCSQHRRTKDFCCVYLIIKTSRFVNLVTYFLGQMLYNSFEKMFRLCGNSICIQIKGTLTQWYKVQDFLKKSVHPNFILKQKISHLFIGQIQKMDVKKEALTKFFLRGSNVEQGQELQSSSRPISKMAKRT